MDDTSKHRQPTATPFDFAGARAYALKRLTHELDPTLYYHCLAHTADDVVPAMAWLAAAEGVVETPLLLLCTAAWFHDIGFVEQREQHEQRGAQIAAAVLPGFAYQPHEIAQITGMIMATRLPQTPHTLLEGMLADADLDVLGRTDFPASNQRLRAELAAAGQAVPDAQWYADQARFLQNHQYWTAAARRRRDAQKQRNIAMLLRLVALARDPAAPPR